MLTLPDWAAGLPLQSEESVAPTTRRRRGPELNAPLAGMLRSYQQRATTFFVRARCCLSDRAALRAGKGVLPRSRPPS